MFPYWLFLIYNIIAFYHDFYHDFIYEPQLDYFTIKRNGVKIKVQTRLFLSNPKETYKQFKDRYPDTKIGISKFAPLRPKECVLVGVSGTHSVRVYTIHNNVELMMAGSKMGKRAANEEIRLQHYSHAIAETMCNPSLPSCQLGD